jgi:molybdopterin molybdotransferase
MIPTDKVRIPYREALNLTLENIQPLPSEFVEIQNLLGRVTAEEIHARVNVPSADSSLKDGFAVFSADVAAASPERPAQLTVTGSAAAGDQLVEEIRPGSAVRILSGAQLPKGSNAVIAEEFTRLEGDQLLVTNHAEPGRNILPTGRDIASGQRLIPSGAVLEPAHIGLLAASGHDRVWVHRQPRVAILATGDEVVAPGTPLQPGKLYASNLVTLAAWCRHYGMEVTPQVVPDSFEQIEASLRSLRDSHDAIITSGGAWSGDRDLVVHVLDQLGWQKIYHKVKIGPGKAIGFGQLEGIPVFCLPGGPPSNYMAFLNLALPGLLRRMGRQQTELPTIFARLVETVQGQLDWTQFIQGRFEQTGGLTAFHPIMLSSRLQMMAQAGGVLTIPEGQDVIESGNLVPIKVLSLS